MFPSKVVFTSVTSTWLPVTGVVWSDVRRPPTAEIPPEAPRLASSSPTLLMNRSLIDVNSARELVAHGTSPGTAVHRVAAAEEAAPLMLFEKTFSREWTMLVAWLGP
jgi:hypothetical protein